MYRRRMEFSKKLFIGVAVLNVAVVLVSFLLMWRVGDLSPLSYLIPSAFGELATATGFYYSKAKRENEIKLRKRYGKLAYHEMER